MHIRVGYELIYDCPAPTPMALMLNIHHTRAGDIIVPDRMTAQPGVPMTTYRDGFATGVPVSWRRQAVFVSRPVRCCATAANLKSCRS